MFERHKVLSRAELEAHVEIKYEGYAKAINIEAKTMVNMAAKRYIPAVIRYTTRLADSIQSVTKACPEADVSVQKKILMDCSALLTKTQTALETLRQVTDEAGTKEDCKEQAYYFKDVVVPAMAALREPIDTLEFLVAKELWPVPTYGDLLFEV
jgi:glutamine synthetase